MVGIWAGNSDNAPVTNIFSTSISFRAMRDVMLAARTPAASTRRSRGRQSVVEGTVCVPSGMKPTEICGKTSGDLFAKDRLPNGGRHLVAARQDRRRVTSSSPRPRRRPVRRGTRHAGAAEGAHRYATEEKKAMEEWAVSLGTTLAPTDLSDAAGTPNLNVRVVIASPFSTQALPLNSAVSVTGRATNANFKSYTLEFGKGTNPSEWTAISTQTNP